MKLLYILVITLSIIGCGSDSESENNTLVYIGTGEIQCEESGSSIEEMEQVLTNQGVEVLSAECGYIAEVSIPSLCGLGTNRIYIFKINDDHLALAEEYNFSSVGDLDYVTRNCE